MDQALREPKFIEDKSLRIQLTPTPPDAWRTGTVAIQAGPYGALWIRLPEKSNVSPDELEVWMNECEAYKQGAVNLAIQQHLLATGIGAELLSVTLRRGYKFGHHHTPTDEMVWYKWCREEYPDLVPSYATSIEGGGALVLSPDRKQMLLVFEHNKWARPGGATDAGESCLDTARREVLEEVGVQLDEQFVMVATCYNQPLARDGIVNDHFMLFVLLATSMELTLDEKEVCKAQWVDIAAFYDAWISASHVLGLDSTSDWPGHVELEGFGKVGMLEAYGIACYVEGRCREVKFVDSNRPNKKLMF